MAFDAGAVEARLTVDTSQFNKDMAAAEARVKRFTDETHKVKISAVFDDASTSKARQAFTQLDNALSKDAMNRLRSSPNGSVLGALNALFSPHPVTGAPSPQQAASGGLLGKIIQSPASGGGTSGGGSGGSTIGQAITSGAAAKSGNTTSTDRVNVLGLPKSGGTISTTDKVSVDKSGITGDAEAAGRLAADAANKGASDEARRNGSGWFRGMLTGVGTLFASAIGSAIGGHGGAESGGEKGASSALGGLVGNTAGGIAPGILGLDTKKSLIVGGIGSALAALPALGGVIGAGVGTALIGGLLAGVVANTPKLKAQFSAIGGDLKTLLSAAAGPVVPAISAVLNQVPGLLKSIEPQLAGVFKVVAPQIESTFTGLVPIIKGLVSLIQAAAPAFGPFIVAIEKLVSGLFPGLVSVTKAVVPVMSQFATIMGQLGNNLGSFFGDLAPAVKASMTVLGALLGLVGGLLPVISKLADVFAAALAPVITQLAGVFKALTPALVIIGKLFADLAGAILGDLVSLFGALASVLVAIAPSLTVFANAISGIFNVLENNGVFATLGDAIESLAGPLGSLINSLLTGLAPILPPILDFIGKLSGLIAGALVSAVTILIPPMTKLATGVLQVMAAVLPVILPLLLAFAGIFTGALVQVLTSVAQTLADIINAIPASVLGSIVAGILAIVGAMKLWAAIQVLLDAELLANPIGLVIAAIALLVIGISELVTHWNTVWSAIKTVAGDAWQWLDANVIQPMVNWFTVSLPHAFDLAVGFVMSHFVTPFQNNLRAAYNWVITNVADPIETLFTKTIPGWFDTAVTGISGFWGKIETVVEAPVKFVVDDVLDPLINLFDSITSAVGLGSPIHPISLSTGGKLPGYGGGDVVPALLEPGEAVIDKDKTRQYAWLFKLLGVPGFATGGVAGQPVLGSRGGGNALAGNNAPGTFGSIVNSVIGGGVDMAKAILAIATGNPTALANAINGMFGGGGSGGMGGVVGQALLGMPAALVSDFAHWIVGTSNTATAQAGGSSSLHPTGVGSTVQALMQSMAASVGWTGAQWTALNAVELAEAGYNLTAVNPGSGAYGLAQFIQGAGEYASYGGNSTTAAGQITGMLNYIASRYGTPEAAEAHEQQYGWYDKGGYLKPGYTLAYNGTGRPERVMGPGEATNDDIIDRLDRLIAVTGAVPAGVGRHVGGTINAAASDASFRRRYPSGGA